MVSTGSTCQLSTSLSSVIAVLDASGNLLSEQRYPSTVLRASLPFGQVRDDVGTIDETDFGYTSQRAFDAQNTAYSLGLMDYRARFYSPYLNHFTQPDTLVPGAGNPQAFNRYSYVMNRPLSYTDPSGHFPWLIIATVMILGTIISGCDVALSPEPSPRQVEIQELIVAGDFQGAIEKAIALYDIPVYASFTYDPKMKERGKTFRDDGSAFIGPEAFNSPDMLVATIAHEAIHQEQLFSGRSYLDPEGEVVGTAINEVEADDWVLSHQSELELSPSTIKSIEQHRDNYLYVLPSWIVLRRKNPRPGDEEKIYLLDDYPTAPIPD